MLLVFNIATFYTDGNARGMTQSREKKARGILGKTHQQVTCCCFMARRKVSALEADEPVLT